MQVQCMIGTAGKRGPEESLLPVGLGMDSFLLDEGVNRDATLKLFAELEVCWHSFWTSHAFALRPPRLKCGVRFLKMF